MATTAALHLSVINYVASPCVPCVYICTGTLNLTDIQRVSVWPSVQYILCVHGAEHGLI